MTMTYYFSSLNSVPLRMAFLIQTSQRISQAHLRIQTPHTWHFLFKHPRQDNFFYHSLDNGTMMVGVCDGHGPFGHIVSLRLVQTLPHLISSNAKFCINSERATQIDSFWRVAALRAEVSFSAYCSCLFRRFACACRGARELRDRNVSESICGRMTCRISTHHRPPKRIYLYC